MRTLTVVLAIIIVTLTTSPVFAEYGYQYNKKGTGYWRDNSNDGNPYNNANYIGLNNGYPRTTQYTPIPGNSSSPLLGRKNSGQYSRYTDN